MNFEKNFKSFRSSFFSSQRHPDGVASVAFGELEAADQCATKMNGRWFGGNQLEVFKWDGFTNYQVRGFKFFIHQNLDSA